MSSSHTAAWVHILLCECAYSGLVTFEHLTNQIKQIKFQPPLSNSNQIRRPDLICLIC
jgi:hypothetical protein